MTLATGTKLGPYEILSPLGAGGMGEVYWSTEIGHLDLRPDCPPQRTGLCFRCSFSG